MYNSIPFFLHTYVSAHPLDVYTQIFLDLDGGILLTEDGIYILKGFLQYPDANMFILHCYSSLRSTFFDGGRDESMVWLHQFRMFIRRSSISTFCTNFKSYVLVFNFRAVALSIDFCFCCITCDIRCVTFDILSCSLLIDFKTLAASTWVSPTMFSLMA